ncbi:P-loop containing nucleoside triphosphate hydrolase protein [Cyathus striatus]|nr:P-loop containing nucleoside triphosphate hydrolase protein [Cyathus striatus]
MLQALWEDIGPPEGPSRSSWWNPLLFPFYVSCLSVVIASVAGLLSLWKKSNSTTSRSASSTENDHVQGGYLQAHTSRFGGTREFTFAFARWVGSVALAWVSVVAFVFRQPDSVQRINPSLLECIAYIYASLLCTLAFGLPKLSSVILKHSTFVYSVSFLVYAYRDLLPLVTYDHFPLDATDGSYLWIKISLLGFLTVIIPLLTPRKYVPVDPHKPMSTPNPEQTASWISLLTYSYANPVIKAAAETSHLSPAQLPPLADTDASKTITEHAYPIVDRFSGGGQRHLFFNLLHVHWRMFALFIPMLITEVAAGFAAPLGINRVLNYLEKGRDNSTLRPGFWVAWLFLGPTVNSLLRNWYQYLNDRMAVRIESLLTQLMLEHTLLARFKASTSGKDDDEEESEDTQNTTGRINTLITMDIDNIVSGTDFLNPFFKVPLQIIVSLLFLYTLLGWSAFVGFGVMLITLPLPGYIASLSSNINRNKMKATEARVEVVVEALNALRMIKLFGWEEKIASKVSSKREVELGWMWKQRSLQITSSIATFCMSSAIMLGTYTAHTVLMKEELSAAKVFATMSVFSNLRDHVQTVFYFFTSTIQAKVSLDRVDDFLRNAETVTDKNMSIPTGITAFLQEEDTRIGFRKALFSWSENIEEPHVYKLRIGDDIQFKNGSLNLIVGPTGSGKTSMLMALLGEMYFTPLAQDSWFSLPRKGKVAYVSQESWIQNDTVRSNILFGSPFDQTRYDKVIRQCALYKDLSSFSAGDMTEVGERGLTLSGGQKARITFARAVYSSAEILLLDDILAALDAHTSKAIIDTCIKGDLLRGRTVILVTHNSSLMTKADCVISIDTNGNAHVISNSIDGKLLLTTMKEVDDSLSSLEPEVPKESDDSDGKLVDAEEVEKGIVSWKAIRLFLFHLGGKHPLTFLAIVLAGIISTDLSTTFQTWFMGYWGAQYDTHHPSEVSVWKYVSIYAAILFISVIFYCFAFLFYVTGILRASREIHKLLLTSVLTTTLRWVDKTPVSRIITRCTRDISSVDGSLAILCWAVTETALSLFNKLLIIVLVNPMSLIPGIFIAIIGYYTAQLYLKAKLPINREMSTAKAPVLSHLHASIFGLVSIRAYGAQDAFKLESRDKIDNYTRMARVSFILDRWMGVRIDALSAFLSSSLAAFLLYRRTTNVTTGGLSLTLSLEICSYTLTTIDLFNHFQIRSNSLERILAYLERPEHEPQSTQSGVPPAAWPTSGELRVDKLSAQYSANGPRVLHELTFNIQSGERVGIVGRTGSGKSSLTLSLLRCIITEGDIYYDGINTKDLNLDALRSNITIIPQVPELLSGTIRKNLDPFDQYNDETLNSALRDSGLFALQSDMRDEARITLESQVASGGNNLSVGQRQIIALARAIVRRSKLLILDEATSAIDYKTDALIQEALRRQVASDTTVITIAHRLQTIMDADKILVLDGGHLIEFDSPKALIRKKGGMFRSLVDASSDKEVLYSIAEGKVLK